LLLTTVFESKILGYSRETLDRGKYLWSFGDGNSKEQEKNKIFEYTYLYPGEYVVILDYYKNFYTNYPKATDRVIIKVIPSEIYISSVLEDSAIELYNDSNYELDLFSWSLNFPGGGFYIPKNTIILPGRKLIFSSQTIGFTGDGTGTVELLYPSGEIAYSFESELDEIISTKEAPVKIIYVERVSENQTNKVVNNKSIIQEEESNLEVNNLPAGQAGLVAAAIESLPFSADKSEEKEPKSNLYLWVLALIGLIVVATSAAFLIKRKAPSKLSDQFKILD